MTANISASSILKTETTQFAQFLHAYHECSEEIREVIDEMTEIIVDPEATEDDKTMAASTIIEAIFPGLSVDAIDSFCNGMQSRESRRIRSELDEEEVTFADRLRQKMDEQGISQEMLATMTGVGQPAISNMLNRQCRPQRRTVARFAQALGVTEADLWTDR
jgi:lambda repressor-like predicted transcriptional regulator